MTFVNTLISIGTRSARTLSFLDLVALQGQRNKLAHLDEAALRDLGLTQADVNAEAKRGFWDVPAHWRG